MKFMLTEEQRSIQRAANEFAKGEFDDDNILELLQGDRFPEKIWKKACKLGFVGLCYPEACGGQECSLMDHVLVVEALCRKDSSVGVALSLSDMGADLIKALGTEDQKKRYLPRLAKGKLMSSALYADADRNDACSADHLVLQEEADVFRLNGQAQYVLNADRAGILVVQCCGSDGNAFVVLEKETDGVTINPQGAKLGMGMLPWYEVGFENVRISRDAVISGVSQMAMNDFRKQQLLKTSAMYLGLGQGAYDQALTYSKQREQFRRKLAEFQGIRHKLVDMYTAVTATRSLVYHCGELMEKGQIDLADLTVIKLQSERTAMDVTYEALQIFGGTGYMVEIPIEHYYRDARMLQCLSGRSLFQKDRVSREIVGTIKKA